MDNFKKSPKGTKVNVRFSRKEDSTLTDLYRKSEFTQESANVNTPTSADETNDDISSFIKNQAEPAQTDIPEKSSAKKHAKKAAKKEKRHKSIKKKVLFLFILLIVIAGATITVLTLFTPNSSQNVIGDGKGDNAEADKIYYAPLTGLESTDSDIANRELTCVMIENSVDARPQSGLRAAGVVYEALAEGGISRFMAIYQDNRPDYFGPIRSARLTFVHLAKPYQCSYIHMGGASNAISELRKKEEYRDINAGFLEGKYVFRNISPGRYAPHNVYSRFAKIDEYNYNKGWTSSSFTPFPRIQPDTTNEVETHDATTINIKLSGDNSYNPYFTYDATTNTYRRFHQRGNAPHMDKAENGALTQISPKVVIAMKVHVIPRSGDVNGYKDHETYGEGDCFVFQDGTVTGGKWRRASVNDPLKFYNTNGTEILLNRGQTWITAYPDTNGTVSWS